MKKKFTTPKAKHFAKQRLPGRPVGLLESIRERTALQILKAQQTTAKQLESARKVGMPYASNPLYIKWLKEESMLESANRLSKKYSGTGFMWQKPYAKPRPRSAASSAPVWYTAYPLSMITRDNETLLQSLGDDKLWQAFQDIGIRAMHTGPMKIAGGLRGWRSTASIDGYFDRVSTKIDPVFGTETQFKSLSQTASKHGGMIIDDIVPGHTGKGPDFRLAEMKQGDYPGIYHMIEIEKKDWGLLPEVASGADTANLTLEQEQALKQHGYIIGKLQRVIFYEAGVKETNWSATKVVRGVDGVERRWVYLHYFKAGQPSLNWLDPSFAGMKLVVGDAIHSLSELGAGALRLDANGFLGVEVGEPDAPAWSEGHPISVAANQIIASMIRKLGGFSFQELNLSVDDIKLTSELGADLSYDFVTRPAYHHAIATGDTEFLRLMLRESLAIGVDPASLVHALQNHDELTHELVHFWTVHANDEYTYHDQQMTGSQLRDTVIKELRSTALDNVSYNMTSYGNTGISSTTVSIICAGLGYGDLSALSTDQVDMIQRAHLLLVKFNAWQPGIIALSGWDLVGALTLDPADVAELIREGDTRWINRGAYDLMGANPGADCATSGLKKAISLYGSLPEQLADSQSFASQLKHILSIREQSGISVSLQVDIPAVDTPEVLVMVHETTEQERFVTVLNFSQRQLTTRVTSQHLPPGHHVTDIATGASLGIVGDDSSFNLSLGPFDGKLVHVSSEQSS